MAKNDFRARFINSLLRRSKNKNRLNTPGKNPKNILIVSTTGIGDTLWGTPAISSLKKSYPNAKLSILTSPLGYQVLKNNPYIDHYYTIKRSALSLFYLYFKLKKKGYDTILIFHISFRWIVPFCYLLKPRSLIGFDRHAKDFASFLTLAQEVGLRHPILQRLSLVQAMGAKDTNPQIQLYLTQEEKEQAKTFLKTRIKDSNPFLVGLQPGASQTFKQWPLQHFISVAKELKKRGCTLVVFGSLDELHLASEIQKEVDVLIASGKLSLRVSAALLSQMNLLITHDTGPMHLALAQKVPMISIFSPTAHDLCWPYLEENWFRLVVKPKTCTTCIAHHCKKPYCMERITPEEVLSHANDFLPQKVCSPI